MSPPMLSGAARRMMQTLLSNSSSRALSSGPCNLAASQHYSISTSAAVGSSVSCRLLAAGLIRTALAVGPVGSLPNGGTAGIGMTWPASPTRGFAAGPSQQPASGDGGGGASGVKEAGEEGESNAEAKQQESHREGSGSEDDLEAQLQHQEEISQKLGAQVEQLTDALKRNLAEMENLRQRTRREQDSAKKFALQSFVKELFDVADNLERCAAVVPKEVLSGGSAGGGPSREQLLPMLKGLLEGVQATEKIMLQTFRKAGVEQYNPINETFDPNLHMALFEVPDANKTPGTIAVVTKRGYKLNERVVRPAEVGVVRAP